jgi:hypothetical protein
MSNSVDGDGGKPIEWLAKSLMRGRYASLKVIWIGILCTG